METSFYVKDERLEECKTFIRKSLPSARFIRDPFKVGNKWNINLELTVEDGNKLSSLQNRWHLEDNPIKKKKKNKLIQFFFNFYVV